VHGEHCSAPVIKRNSTSILISDWSDGS
jgi:hypothetical protein